MARDKNPDNGIVDDFGDQIRRLHPGNFVG